jgi:hypothetical protein
MCLEELSFGSFKIAAFGESRISTLRVSADLQHMAQKRTFGGLFSDSVGSTV